MTRLILSIASLVSFAVAAFAAEPRNVSPAKLFIALGYEEVALRRTDENRFYIFARVDGRKRSCLVDSGWSFTTISTNTAGRLAVSNRIEQLTLGDVVISNLAARVQDMRVAGQPASFDIVLGCDFLLAHNAVLDFPSQKLYLRRDPLSETDNSRLEILLRETGRKSATMKILQPPAPVITARLNGREMDLLVDSGATWSCIDDKVARQMGLRVPPSANQMSGAVSTDKKSYGVASLDELSVSDTRLKSANFAALSLADWGLGPDGKLFPEVHGIFGATDLLANRALIDFSAKKIWFDPRHSRSH